MTEISKQLSEAAELHRAGNLSEAMNRYEEILSSHPNHPETLHLYGMGHFSQGKLDAAVVQLSKAINQDSNRWIFHLNLGLVYRKQGALPKAVAANQKAATLAPEIAPVHFNLGRSLQECGRNDEAIASYQKAIELDSNLNAAFNNLGLLLRNKGLITEAIQCFKAALKLAPDSHGARANLGGCYKDISKTKESIEQYTKVLEQSPSPPSGIHSNLLFATNYSNNYSPSEVYKAHIQWATTHESPIMADRFPPLPPTDKKLRIGFLSADFKVHSVAFFIAPVIEEHRKRGQVDIYCYSDVSNPDAMTQQIENAAFCFHSIHGSTDLEVANQIKEDEIDILIDLAGHSSENRLLLFARKPAPIQATYLGYPNTTGMSSIQYRLTDSNADPEPQADAFNSETLVRLPNGFHCFGPPESSPQVGPLPALSNGHITFGSFNNLAKVTPEVVELWAKLLHRVDGSRLLVKASALRDPGVKDSFAAQFEAHSITPDRLDLVAFVPSLADHLMLYQQIDIGLDPFPYNGTTTTCEAFWMGIPVITLAGKSHPGRVGISLLDQVGLLDWVAATPEHYIELASQFSESLKDLGDLRQSLRARMQNSQLTQAPLFAAALEDAYQTMVALEREKRT